MWWIRRTWDVAVAAAAGVLAATFVTPATWDKVTAEVVAFLAIQAAAVLPAMIFTAGVLRPDGLSPADVERFQLALRAQMRFWISLFALEFAATFAWIAAKAAQWTLTVPAVETYWAAIDASWAWSGFVIFLTSLAMLRTIPFVRGVLSLLDLTGELTRRAVLQRIAQQREGAQHLSRVDRPDGYGEIIHH